MFSNFFESLYEGIGDDDSAAVDDDDNTNPRFSSERHNSEIISDRLSPEEEDEEEAQARGVKDDLTEFGHTLTRQFRGVANFLAPLPDGSSSDLSKPRLNHSRSSDPGLIHSRCLDPRLDQSRSSGRLESCVGSDATEDEIRARSSNLETVASGEKGIVNVSNDPEEEEEEEEEETDEEEEEEIIDAVALTDEVLAFARNIAMHPETWLDFPLDPDEDLDELEMSDAQRGHALAIERLAPRLAALRIELCPCHMSVGYFWKVYFVLLHSRLNKHDAQLLSSPQVMEARALWMKELHNYNPSSKEGRDHIHEEEITPSTSNYYKHAPPEFLSPRIYAFEPPSIIYRDYDLGNYGSENAQFIDKAVIEEKPIQKNDRKDQTAKDDDTDDDEDDWLKEEDPANAYAPMFTVNEDDVSFSDLEGDDDISSLALKSKKITLKETDEKGT